MSDWQSFYMQLRDRLLKMQLQKEIESARVLESEGKMREASEHYLTAAGIYRRIAYDSPMDTADDVFRMASQYEDFSRALISRAAVKTMAAAARPISPQNNIRNNRFMRLVYYRFTAPN